MPGFEITHFFCWTLLIAFFQTPKQSNKAAKNPTERIALPRRRSKMVTALVFTPLKFNSSPLKKDGKGRRSGFLLGWMVTLKRGELAVKLWEGFYVVFNSWMFQEIGSSCFLS